MNFMVEVRKNVAIPWMGQLNYVGVLTKSKLCNCQSILLMQTSYSHKLYYQIVQLNKNSSG